MAELHSLLTIGKASEEVVYAWELHKHEEHRPVVDAFLLAKAPAELISKVLGIPQNVIDAYVHLFLDTAALRNRLEVLSYASAYEGSAYARDLVRTAVTVGVEYLLWLQGVAPELEPRSIVRRTMTDAFYRGLAHRGNSLSSATTKEANKWWHMAIRNAEILEKMDPRATKSAYEELEIALEGRDETLTPDKAPVSPDQILH